MTKSVIVDACVAIKWFVAEADSDLAGKLFASDLRRHAPDFAVIEIANALWKIHRRGDITSAAATKAIELAPRFFWSLPSSKNFVDEAFQLATSIQHPVYDCLYVVISRRMKAPLITSDTKLLAKFAGSPDAANVVLLRDWKA